MKQLAAEVTARLKTDFERSLFDAAIRSFNESSNPLRTNNFAYAIRELSRHVLQRLAPDKCISQCIWYEPHINDRGTVVTTRAQRITYAVQGGLANAFVQEELDIDLATMRSNFVRVVDRLSKFAHIEEDVFNIEEALAQRVASGSLEALIDLFSTIINCRGQIAHSVVQHVDRNLMSSFLEHTFDSLDELATHHLVEAVQVESVSIKTIDHRNVVFSVDGYVECELQYGSSGDLRRGDGAVLNDSFPFTCEFTARTDSPVKPVLNMESLVIDNRSWYE